MNKTNSNPNAKAPTIDADKTFYAVFAIASGSGSSNTYALVSNVANLSDGDKIILVSTGSYTASGTTYDFTKGRITFRSK